MTTTGNELAVREEAAPALHVPALPGLPDTDTWIRAMASIAKLASIIAHTGFVPDGMRGDEGAVTAAILTGRELDMGPMQSLRNIHVIKGIPSLRAEFKRAKVLAAGHEFRILEWDARHCKVAARRRGDRGEPTVVEYTLAEAEAAGLVKRNDNYRTDPMAMLMARVTTRVTTAIFADVTNGLATTELLGDADAFADAIGAALELPAAPRPEVADLRQRAAAQTVTAHAVPDALAAAPETAATLAPQGLVGVIQGHLERLGVTERDGKLRVASRLAGRPLESSKDLTRDEAGKILGTLEGLAENTDLAGLLADIALAGDPRENGEAGE